MRVLLTRVAVGAATAAVSLGLLVGTTAPAAAAGCTTKYDTYSTVKAGKKGSKAGAVECLLRQAGYPASHNRSFSAADAKKLSAFQGEHRLPATGRADAATWSALIAQGTSPALQHGDRGTEVRRLQLALRALGHPELPGTTLYGDLTTAAVRSFQAGAGLPVTGQVAGPEWSALQGVGGTPRPRPPRP